ncbi:MAG TPA: Ig-like domain-containing protein [Kofleriaceae bacterium]|nr:Ig-like domain-containing protein [Kofleriaceae bacterium]
MGHFMSPAILLVGIGCSSGSIEADLDSGPERDAGGRDAAADELRVLSTQPVSDAVRVETNASIVVAFSRPVRPATVTPETFAVSGPSGPVAGALAVEGETVTFVPDAPLHLLGSYDVTLTTGIASDDGTLVDPYRLSFRVADGVWSSRLDLALDVGAFLSVEYNRRGDMVLAFTTASAPATIKAVRFDAARRAFFPPELLEEDDQPFGAAHAAINDGGDVVVAWSGSTDPESRGWVRYHDGIWGTPAVEPGTAGLLGLTSNGTAIMASQSAPGADALIEVLGPTAAAWTTPEIAVPMAAPLEILQSGDRLEILALVDAPRQLVARGYTQGVGFSDTQALSAAGETASAVHFECLPGDDLNVSWVRSEEEIWYARFDGAAHTWAPAMLAEGGPGSAICANSAGARLAAFISDGSIYAVHADPGQGFSAPRKLGSPLGMEYARCAIDELGNGVLFWARASGQSFRSRFADGVFSAPEELGNGPTMKEAVTDPLTGAVRVVFYTGVSLTARTFE